MSRNRKPPAAMAPTALPMRAAIIWWRKREVMRTSTTATCRSLTTTGRALER